MAERLMENAMWTRGRAILARGGVTIVDIKPYEIQASVDGTEQYTVILGMDAEDDECSCPYFPDHGYCKHIAAVVLYFKAQNQSIGDVLDAATAEEDAQYAAAHPVASSGSQLVTELNLPDVEYFHGLTPSNSTGLTLEFNLEVQEFTEDYYNTLLHFVAWVRIADKAVGKFYAVRNIGDFLNAYRMEDDYQTSGKAHFVLNHSAFTAAERTLLEILDTSELVQIHELTNGDSRYLRYVRLVPGTIARLQSVLPEINHFNFQNYREDVTYHELTIAPYTPDNEFITFRVKPKTLGYEFDADAEIEVVPDEQALIHGNQCALATVPQFDAISRLLLLPNPLTDAHDRGELLEFHASDVNQLRQLLKYCAQIAVIDAPDNLLDIPMTPHFDLTRAGNAADLRLSFEYGDRIIAQDSVFDTKMPRNHAKEEQADAYLYSLGFTSTEAGYHKDFTDAAELYRFFTRELPNMRANGEVTLDPALAALMQDGTALGANVAVDAKDGLLSVAFSFKGIDASDVDAVLAQLDQKQPYVQKADGTLYVVDDELRKVASALQRLRQDGEVKNGRVHVPAAHAFALQSMLGDTAEFDAKFKQLAQDLAHPEQFPFTPQTVNATLRPYQILGVQWLEMLNSHGFGGILADEMGLGKTLQMLTFLNDHLDHQHVSLVVAPASLLYNWQAECQKFAPNVRVAVVDGTKAERQKTIFDYDNDLLITSYNTAHRDIDDYLARDIQYLILDEAQVVKNGSAKTNQSLRKLTPQATFALSGTPIENRAEELWSIFALVLPGLLPKKSVFKKMSAQEIAMRVKPFIMRREKRQVLKDLPPMVETNLTNEMTKEQKTVYLAQLRQMQVQVRGLSDTGLVKNKIAILAGLTRIRQVCDTPALYLDNYHGTSGKLEQLDDLIQQAQDSGRHVLIFSQFTHMLDQIDGRLAEAGLDRFVLKGETRPKDRLQMVDAFNRGEKNFFLISLKAGGTGLNLTGADMVILVDLWWNPAVEDQAIARAHRIGQEHEVDVYRLVTKGTIEEKIVQLQAQKRDFVDQVLSGTQNKAMLTNEDLRMILGV
jgi:superfamily II DNA or RNA helicase